jgi:hypothetical protein
MINHYRLYHTLVWVGVLVSFSNCVKLPTDPNGPPGVPLLGKVPGDYSYAIPCTLLVTSTDPDGDQLAYQFEIDEPYYSLWLSDWTSYYPSGEEVGLLLEGEEGTYEVRARARDTTNEMSDFSNVVSVVFANAAPYPPETPSGDTLLPAGTQGTFTTRGDDYEGDKICFRYDPGNGEAYSEWGPLQYDYYDYEFSFAYPDAGVFGLRAQCKDENGGISAWSEELWVHVLANLQLVGSCGIPGGAEKVWCEGDYAYLSTSGNGLQIANVGTPAVPGIEGGHGSFSSTEVCHNGEAAFLLSVQTFDAILYSYDVSSPETPSLLDQIEIDDGEQLDVEGEYALVGAGWFEKTLHLLDISNPADMRVIASLEVAEAADVALAYPRAYVMEAGWSGSNLYVLNVDVTGAPYIIASLELPYEGPICLGPAGYLYAATRGTYYAKLSVVSIQNPANPHVVREIEIDEDTYDLHYEGAYLALAHGSEGLELFDVSDPASPEMIGQVDTPGSCKGVYCRQQYLHVADGSGGLLIYSYPTVGRPRPMTHPQEKKAPSMRLEKLRLSRDRREPSSGPHPDAVLPKVANEK